MYCRCNKTPNSHLDLTVSDVDGKMTVYLYQHNQNMYNRSDNGFNEWEKWVLPSDPSINFNGFVDSINEIYAQLIGVKSSLCAIISIFASKYIKYEEYNDYYIDRLHIKYEECKYNISEKTITFCTGWINPYILCKYGKIHLYEAGDIYFQMILPSDRTVRQKIMHLVNELYQMIEYYFVKRHSKNARN